MYILYPRTSNKKNATLFSIVLCVSVIRFFKYFTGINSGAKKATYRCRISQKYLYILLIKQ